MSYSGKLILILGPSGSGKSTLVAASRKEYPHILFPASYTTRAMRGGEVNGTPYTFVSQSDFDRMIERGEFLEWAEFDGGKKYGTAQSDVLPALESGKFVIKEVEVQGTLQVLAKLPKESVVTIFISAGSWDELEKRVRARAPITDEELVLRKERFEREMKYREHATYTMENPYGELETSIKRFFSIIDQIQS